MAIRRSVGCNCCSPVVEVDPIHCCKLTILKPYVDQIDDGSGGFTFDGVAHTAWRIESDETEQEPHYVTGDVPTEDTNILPANSTIEFSADICCYDYLFDIQFIDIDPLDDETLVRCGASRWKARAGESLIQSSMEFYENTDTWTHRAVQFSSFLGTGGVLHEVHETELSHWNTGTPLSENANYSPQYYIRSINSPSDFVGQPTRTVRLTIETGAYPITIGGVTFKQGVNTLEDNFSTDSCVRVRGLPATGVRRNEGDLWPRRVSSINSQGGVEQAWRLNSGGSITVAGYDTVEYDFEYKGIAHSSCSTTSQAHVTGSGSLDLSFLNGTYNRVLARYDNDENATADEYAGIANMVQSCADGIFKHDDNIFEHWNYYWYTPRFEMIDARGSGGTSNCTIANDIPDSCPDRLTASSAWNYTVAKQEPATVLKWVFSSTEDPCFDFDFANDIGVLSNTDCPDTGGIVDGLDPSSPFAAVDIDNMTPVTSAWTTCNVQGVSQLAYVPSWYRNIFGYNSYTHDESGGGNVTGSPYTFRTPLTEPQINLLQTSQAETTEIKPVRTVFQSTGDSNYTAVSDASTNGSLTNYVFGQTYINNFSVTSGYTATIQGEERHCFLGNTFDDDDSRSFRLGHPDDREGECKAFKNVMTDFTVNVKEYDSNGDLDTESTVTQDTSVDVIVPDLINNTVEYVQDPFNPWNYIPQNTTRPSGVYNDGKFYYYSDTNFTLEWTGTPVQTFPAIIEVTDSAGDVWHILLGSNGYEARNTTQNYKLVPSNRSYVDQIECDPSEFTWVDGTAGPDATVTTITFKLKGQE